MEGNKIIDNNSITENKIDDDDNCIFYKKKKIPQTITLEWLNKMIDDFIVYHNSTKNIKPIADHRNIYTPKRDDKYYLEQIYNTYEIDDFFPELIFCENDEELNDIWLYYRLKVSSCNFSKISFFPKLA